MGERRADEHDTPVEVYAGGDDGPPIPAECVV